MIRAQAISGGGHMAWRDPAGSSGLGGPGAVFLEGLAMALKVDKCQV
jgi:hypothetical protein